MVVLREARLAGFSMLREKEWENLMKYGFLIVTGLVLFASKVIAQNSDQRLLENYYESYDFTCEADDPKGVQPSFKAKGKMDEVEWKPTLNSYNLQATGIAQLEVSDSFGKRQLKFWTKIFRYKDPQFAPWNEILFHMQNDSRDPEYETREFRGISISRGQLTQFSTQARYLNGTQKLKCVVQ